MVGIIVQGGDKKQNNYYKALSGSRQSTEREIMMTAKEDEWTLKTAMDILRHPTVDSRLWAEAAEWLLLYGPPEIKELLQQASGHAAQQSFPDLTPSGFTANGQACYNVADLARSLGISEDEAAQIIAEKEKQHGIRQLFGDQETSKLQ